MNKLILSSKIFSSSLYAIIACMFVRCTDHKTTIPFDFPDYKPQLVVLSSVGTISGGEVFLSWSKPLKGQEGTVPELPKATVFLLESGMPINRFVADSDAIGYYVLKADQLSLVEGKAYALEIVLADKGQRIVSQDCYLPEKPNLQNVRVEVDPQTPFWYDLLWIQGKAKAGIGATVLHPYLLGSDHAYMDIPRLGIYYRSSEFRYTDGTALPERHARRRFERYIDVEEKVPAEAVDVRLAFLSPELALFKKELDELGYLGESVFQTVRPLYTNMNGAVGIFGLYNESSVVVDFEE